MKPLLTTAEVAAVLRVSDYSVRGYCRSGALVASRPNGGPWRVSPEALERFIARPEAEVRRPAKPRPRKGRFAELAREINIARAS